VGTSKSRVADLPGDRPGKFPRHEKYNEFGKPPRGIA